MNVQTREIKSFFYSQYFSDGLRVTLGILLPALVFNQLNLFDTGITLSLGALCVSITDTPGPTWHKRNAMAICNASVFIVAVLTGFARLNLYTLGAEIFICCFFFSILTIYGNKAAAVGTASLLVMILMMGKANDPKDVLPYSLLILAGGVWYMLQSLIFFSIRPFRAAQQSLGENIIDVVRFLRIKANFYREGTNIEDNYTKIISAQIQVSEHQDVVRELLFKSRLLVKESTYGSRILVMTFVDLVDLFERIMATHYDYSEIHKKFDHTGILHDIADMIDAMADKLDNVGFSILSNTRHKNYINLDSQLEALKLKIDAVGQADAQVSNLVLKKILVNLRDVNKRINDVVNYYNTKSSDQLMGTKLQSLEYSKFVSHQDYSPQIFFDNLTFSSAAFKHALRVALVCIAGFIITKSAEVLVFADYITGRQLAFGHHSYWVLLTIIVILKPGYSLSKQRNYQRLTGTIIGGLLGALILIFVQNAVAQFILLLVFMLGSYSFQRLNYVVFVALMTPYILILFKFLGVGHTEIVRERIIDTIIGSVIAFVASSLLFPSWESETLTGDLGDVITANNNYLVTIADGMVNGVASTTEYKLARKQVYVSSANLSAAFERMTSEPKSKQRKSKEVHKFVVLNHILSSYLSTVAASLTPDNNVKPQADLLKLIKKSINVLNETAKKLSARTTEFNAEKAIAPTTIAAPNADDKLFTEQFDFINKIVNDIARVTDNYLK